MQLPMAGAQKGKAHATADCGRLINCPPIVTGGIIGVGLELLQCLRMSSVGLTRGVFIKEQRDAYFT